MADFDLDVSRETSERLDILEALLKKWNPKINLVSSSTLADVRNRHIADSAQIFRILQTEARTLADFGSGGGFPGLVLAILSGDRTQKLDVTLVESDRRKCSFLQAVLRETGIEATVISDRIEHISRLETDVITARALASLDSLLSYAAQHCTPKTVCFFPKGRNWNNEVKMAEKRWKFSCTPHKSKTDPNAVILEIRDLSHD